MVKWDAVAGPEFCLKKFILNDFYIIQLEARSIGLQVIHEWSD